MDRNLPRRTARIAVRGENFGSLRHRVVAGRSALLLLALTSGATAQAASSPDDGGSDRLDPRITEIMRKPDYPNAQWGLLQQDPDSGRVVNSRFAEQFFIPGSVAKLFGTSGAWDTLGGDHRFKTPVYAVGERRGSTLNGNLGLVAQGDLTMGGRTRPDGTVDYTDLDHTYANDFPGATLTPENPLAGINKIAQQVRKSGITRVNGNVIVAPPGRRPHPGPYRHRAYPVDRPRLGRATRVRHTEGMTGWPPSEPQWARRAARSWPELPRSMP